LTQSKFSISARVHIPKTSTYIDSAQFLKFVKYFQISYDSIAEELDFPADDCRSCAKQESDCRVG